MTYKKIMRLGDLLLDLGKISIEQLDDALLIQEKTKQKLGEIMLEKKYFTEAEFMDILSKHMGIEKVNLSNYIIDTNVINTIPQSLLKKFNAMPIGLNDNRLVVAMSDPMDIYAIEDMEMNTGLKVQPVLASKQAILNTIDKYFSAQSAEKALEDFEKESIKYEVDNLDEDALSNVGSAPVVRLIDTIIRQALKSGASDIHIEPYEEHIRVRYRIDGKLIEIMNTNKNTHSAIVTRIKIISGLNIAEKRLPQDGRVEMKIDSYLVDLRVSVLPTVYGEKIVIRLLDRSNFLKRLDELGMSERSIESFKRILEVPNGIILVTGPTGSGKTTTLYTVLNSINNNNKNIITVEDPVEYKLEGINQVQVNTKAGLLFSTGLRSILRQDPDVIMIGEIRDNETAEIAVRAAITGHLVISTMHTNDAPATVSRLFDMGIKPYLINSSVRGIVAQRLVRKICDNCKEEYEASNYEKSVLNMEDHENLKLYRGTGCHKCHNTGYSGRTAIHEVMRLSKSIRDIIQHEGTTDKLREVALQEGMYTLNENCRDLVIKGITTIDEYFYIAYKYD